MVRNIIAAALLAVVSAGAASAATLSGTFTVGIYHRVDATSAQSEATAANLAASTLLQTITYTGDIDFATSAGDSTTIMSWLSTGVNGSFTTLLDSVKDIQLSRADITNGSAITTFFDFTATFLTGFNSVITHDDGITAFDDGVAFASSVNPTTVIDTIANGFDGGKFRLIYAATNSDPSILKITGENLPSPVPVPAAFPLLLAGIGALGAMRRRRAKS